MRGRRMRPDVVTFWHGPLDRLRQTCLRSQVAVGHKVTVYSFDPLPGLPDGVGNAEAEAILPHAFSERLRPPEPDGSWRDWTILQFSDFFRMRLMAQGAGLWLDADVLLLEAGRDRPGKTLFRLGAAAPARQLRPLSAAGRSDRAGVRGTDGAGGTDAGLAGAAPSPDLHAATPARRIEPPLRHPYRDLWPGLAHRARPPRRANCSTRCRSNRSMRCTPSRNCFSSRRIFPGCSRDPEIIGLHISPKGRGGQPPVPGSLYAWASGALRVLGLALPLFPMFDLPQRASGRSRRYLAKSAGDRRFPP